MEIQPVGLTLNGQYPLISASAGKSNMGHGIGNLGGSAQGGSNLGKTQQALLSENYSVNKLLLNYKNEDGDSVSLSLSSVDYQKAILTASEDTSSESWQKIIDQIKDDYVKMKGSIVNALFGNNEENAQMVSDPRAFDESKEIPGLPEYWNAENTSQRIVDFAVSFAGMYKGGNEEFVSMIKDAIEQGFSQARDILGNLPDPVGKLVDKTHALVMDKIDKWASDRNTGAETIDNQSIAANV
jgi:hypothetical protein